MIIGTIIANHFGGENICPHLIRYFMNASTKTIPETENLSELLDLATGYQKAKVLFSFAELNIADILQEKPLSAKENAEIMKINPLAMERFLNACVSIGLLEKTGENY